MLNYARLLAATSALCAGAVMAQAAGPDAATTPAGLTGTAQSPEFRLELKSALPQARLIGKARLAVWGFQIYDARLWVQPGFGAANYTRAPLALELDYLRGFSAADVAERSIKEIRRSVPISDAQASKWKADMLRVIPDVQKGDRILGVYQPGVGASFWFNGKRSGDVKDAEFARLFFGIWLSPTTSEPQLREALLAGAAG